MDEAVSYTHPYTYQNTLAEFIYPQASPLPPPSRCVHQTASDPHIPPPPANARSQVVTYNKRTYVVTCTFFFPEILPKVPHEPTPPSFGTIPRWKRKKEKKKKRGIYFFFPSPFPHKIKHKVQYELFTGDEKKGKKFMCES